MTMICEPATSDCRPILFNFLCHARVINMNFAVKNDCFEMFHIYLFFHSTTRMQSELFLSKETKITFDMMKLCLCGHFTKLQR